MTRQIVRKRVSDLKPGPNIRSDLGDEAELRRLGNSLKKRQRTPVLIRRDGTTVIDGHRTLRAAQLVGIEELECVIEEEDLQPVQVKTVQLVSSKHRADISEHDTAVTLARYQGSGPEYDE